MMKQINVRIPREVHRAIKIHSEVQDKTMAVLVREILTEYAEALCKR